MINIRKTVIGKQTEIASSELQEWALQELALGRNSLIKTKYKNVLKISPDISNTEVIVQRHPLTFALRQDDQYITVIDTRNYERPDGKVRNQREVDAMLDRALLSHVLIAEPMEYKAVINQATAVFVEWVTTLYRNNLGAGIAEIDTMKVFLSGYYLLSIYDFGTIKHFTEERIREITLRFCSSKLRIADGLLRQIIDSEEFIRAVNLVIENGVDDLDYWLEQATIYINNPSIILAKTALMHIAISVSWIGDYKQELSCGAIEFPAYLVWMIGEAISIGFYRKTRVGKAVDDSKRARVDVAAVQKWINEIKLEYTEG